VALTTWSSSSNDMPWLHAGVEVPAQRRAPLRRTEADDLVDHRDLVPIDLEDRRELVRPRQFSASASSIIQGTQSRPCDPAILSRPSLRCRLSCASSRACTSDCNWAVRVLHLLLQRSVQRHQLGLQCAASCCEMKPMQCMAQRMGKLEQVVVGA